MNISWPSANPEGWIEVDVDVYFIRIYPLNKIFEWEICVGDAILDAGEGATAENCKSQAENALKYIISTHGTY